MRQNKILKSSRIIFSVFLAAILMGNITFAQETKNQLSGTPDHPSYQVKKASSAIKVDGILDEPAWNDATVMKILFEYMPGDNIPAPVDTDFLITFSENNLYMAFRCYDPDPSQIRGHLMDRDAIDTFIQDDHVTIMIDFFNDERRGFQFRVNPLGVQADANFSEMEGYEDFSEVYDFFDISSYVFDIVDLNEIAIVKEDYRSFDLVTGCANGSFAGSFGFHLCSDGDESIKEMH